jgi:hypothetical protein
VALDRCGQSRVVELRRRGVVGDGGGVAMAMDRELLPLLEVAHGQGRPFPAQLAGGAASLLRLIGYNPIGKRTGVEVLENAPCRW